jgi:hypothetical protein
MSGPEITRRKILAGALYGAALLGLSGCDKLFNRLQQSRRVEALLDSAETASRGFLRLLGGAASRRSSRRKTSRATSSRTATRRRSQTNTSPTPPPVGRAGGSRSMGWSSAERASRSRS